MVDRWSSPVPLKLVPTASSESFRGMRPDETGLPLPPHPGSFGFVRKHHAHEGIDLYCAEGTPVTAAESGTVVAIHPFTGAHCNPPSDWWLDTFAVMVEGRSGVILYGELVPAAGLIVGTVVTAGDVLGHVTRVLRHDKGRPTTMLHLELYEAGTRTFSEWKPEHPTPPGLLDPTPRLMSAVGQPEIVR